MESKELFNLDLSTTEKVGNIADFNSKTDDYFDALETQLGFFIQSRIEDDDHEQEIVNKLNVNYKEFEKILVGDFSVQNDQQFALLKEIVLIMNIEDEISEVSEGSISFDQVACVW